MELTKVCSTVNLLLFSNHSNSMTHIYIYTKILCVAFLLFPIALFAQVVTLKDKNSALTIENVFVQNKTNTKTVISDKKGRVDITPFADNDSLYFRHLAYNTVVFIKKNIPLDIFLIENTFNLDEVVFSANKIDERKTDLAQKIDVISAKQITFNNPQTSGDVLAQSGQVFLQTSQAGGGSPVLRGFEANKVLTVIDGVRMNNAIYRGGHLQNVITIDPNMLERVEILYGAGSVVYGSDALGGVMHFFTKNPTLSMNKKTVFSSGALIRYASANQERTQNINFSIGTKKWGFLTNITYKEFGDLRAGTNRKVGYEDFWKRTVTQEFIDGKDVTTPNENVNLQTLSGYTQYDILQKVMFKPNDNQVFTLNLQYSNSSNIPRYDRYSESDSRGVPNFAVWDYGPQKRLMASLKASFKADKGMYDAANFVVGYQNIGEERITRRFGKTARTHRQEKVNVYTFNADLSKTLATFHELRYGAEFTYNQVGSNANEIDIIKNTSKIASTRYPDGGSEVQSFAGYITHNWELAKKNEYQKIVFSQGLRYSSISQTAHFVEKSIFPFPFDDASLNNSAFNYNIGFVAMLNRSWRFNVLASSGFRVPNIDDIGRVFDSQRGNVIVPNTELKPEQTYNFEAGISKNFADKVLIEVTGFYTIYNNAIVVRTAKFNGQDSIIYDGVKSRVQANVNAFRAEIYGFQANIKAQITDFLQFKSTLTYTKGTVTSENAPLDHIPPLYGQTSLKANIKKFQAEFFVSYQGWKKIGDYSPSGEDNLQYATPDGMPSWTTLNLRTAYQVTNFLQAQVALENITDRHYRVFASGISSAGRNLVVTLRANF